MSEQPASLPRSHIYLWAVAISCILSLISILNNPLVGSDGVTYLRSAQAFIDAGMAGALATYNYPSYPVLIAWVHLCTGLSLVNSAYLLNTLLFGLLVVAFIRLAQVCYGTQHITMAAALIVLCNPELNSMRADVYRDFGAWAFTLLAAGYFIRFNQAPYFKFALAWFLASLGAAAFRPEAAVILAACLLYFVYYPNGCKQSAQRLIRLLVLPSVLVCAVALLSLFVSNDAVQHIWQVVNDKLNGSLTDPIKNFRALATQYQQHVLVPRTDLSSVSLLAGLLALLLIALLKILPLPYLIMYGAGIRYSTQRMRLHSRWPFAAILLAISAPPAAFLISQRFLQDRYVMPVALLLCVPISAYVADWYQRCARQRRFRGAAVALMVVLLIDGLISFGSNKEHISRAIAWFEQNSHSGAVVTANDTRGMFQLQRKILWEDSIAFKQKTAGGLEPCERGDYYLHLHKKNEPHGALWRNQAPRGKLLAYFENNRATHADIYRCIPEEQ